MATERAAGERRVPTQEDYERDVHETRWVELDDGDGYFKVQEVAPLKLLREMDRYGVLEMMGGSDDDVDMADVLRDGDLNGFIEDVVLPNVIDPDCHWGDVGDGDFDLGALSATDLMVVITGMTGQEQDDLQRRMDEKFRG